ncbi:hypothetical protein JANAI62_29260 [Jannaschia pagri]|uniref:Tellurite resistance protein TerB n=1 Tax=Jannaschia pagri TaxID=2829797 RepID=A0ABQ4NPJ8_9RHOB|nr:MULTISPECIES: hypothetical protein [unclassified Jannaschia]GIT92468.1 hypothetical protein JANAI61_29260 [Jannaschia sp. AI_61]GIT96303.1 hypothetical protein JANAI62_29260 [Jannaschia sp. AI_62]
MPYFADLRATARHGDRYRRAKAILIPAVIASAVHGRTDLDAVETVARAASDIPGLTGFDFATLRGAVGALTEELDADGGDTLLEMAEARLTGHAGVSAVLLATEVALARGTPQEETDRVLDPLTRRLGIDGRRLHAIRLMAAQRLQRKETLH